MRKRHLMTEFERVLSFVESGGVKRPLQDFLVEVGYHSGAASAENILLLHQSFQIDSLYDIVRISLRAPSPDTALNSFERLAGVIPPAELDQVVGSRRRLSQFLRLCGSSPFLVNLIFRTPADFRALFLDDAISVSRSAEETLALLRSQVDGQTDFNGLMKILRCFKRSEILRIAARDLNGLAPLEEVTAELSGLAAASLQVAHEVCRRCLIREYGVPLMLTENGSAEAEMTVIGMGKLGGRELNFSSDIDIIYFYESDKGATRGVDHGGQLKGVVSLLTFFSKLGEMISRALSQVTEDGFVFRVDVGLRPEGKAGDMAVSLRSAEIYYESWGQSWERTAMIKARPLAGSLELGEQLLTMLQPFVYRKYLDYNLVEDMKNMKLKIDAALSQAMQSETNLKLGRGGIREIEFFIQALQLVFAGRNPDLRERNSLRALDKLLEARLIKEDDHRKLSEAYRFLRTVEHRIQVVQERQTHNLPTKDEEMLVLARRCGFTRRNGQERFTRLLEEHRANVSAIFADLFHSRDRRLKKDLNPEVLYFLDPNAEPDLVKDMLAERRFEDVERAYENLLTLRNGPAKGHLTERSHRMLQNIAPVMLQEIFESPDPDMALANLEHFLTVIASRSIYYALLAENPKTLKLLLSLFGMSEFLSKILISHPEMLESMVVRSHDSTTKSKDFMETELSVRLKRSEYFEDQLDMLRRYRNREFLRIGLHDIHGRLKQAEITSQLTLVSEVCLAAAYRLAVQEMKRFGRPLYRSGAEEGEANLAVIAMGKMGGGDLNYHSDLDVIFVYDHQGMTDGEKQISNHEYFAKLVQKIISILTLQTREGYVYKIDTRLRPSGNAGPLVTSLESFLEYHRKESQIWERQALTRARVVLGNEQLAAQLHEVIGLTVYGDSLNDAGRSEIHRLRMRMENELARESAGSYNIKTGRGGMVDVEFVTQYLQLRYGCHYPELRTTNTVAALKEIRALELVPDDVAESLYDGYIFLRKLENRLRIIHDHSANELSGPKNYMNKLALRLGYDPTLKNPGAMLISDYEATTGRIRDCYDWVMGVKNGI